MQPCDPALPLLAVEINGTLATDDCLHPESTPEYRIAQSFDVMPSSDCARPYVAWLGVRSYRPTLPPCALPIGTYPMTAEATGAEVTLRDAEGAMLDTGSLPNPYTISATGHIPWGEANPLHVGAAKLEAVPAAYRDALRDIGARGETFIVAVTLQLTTSGGDMIEAPTYEMEIDACEGCALRCRSTTSATILEDYDQDTCREAGLSDGRFCYTGDC